MLEFEYWWLLALPLFFALGWLAARVDIKQLLSESSALPAAYFKGLNFLIKEQHDKAIEAFSEAVQGNVESLELHFALGSLFRRRGEIDRAIHLHQTLLKRPQLEENQKWAVEAELAQDYLKAGLFDRAEALFQGLKDTPYQLASTRSLLEIYVREREWLPAIETAQHLAKISGVSFDLEIAQFHCELAAKALIKKDEATARLHLKSALTANPVCARANVMLGEIEAFIGNHSAAIEAWERIEAQQPEALGLIASPLFQSYRAIGKTHEGKARLTEYVHRYKLPTVLGTIYDATLSEQGADEAAKLAREELSKQPGLRVLERLLQARSLSQHGDRQDVDLIQNTVQSFLSNSAAYRCSHCGFRARRHYWQCPGCTAWESFPPEPKEPLSR